MMRQRIDMLTAAAALLTPVLTFTAELISKLSAADHSAEIKLNVRCQSLLRLLFDYTIEFSHDTFHPNQHELELGENDLKGSVATSHDW